MLKEEEEFCPTSHNFNLQEIGFLYKISLPFVNIQWLWNRNLYLISHFFSQKPCENGKAAVFVPAL